MTDENDLPIIPDLPDAPLRNDPEELFAEKGSVFVGALNPWSAAIKALSEWIQAAWIAIKQYWTDTEAARDQAIEASEEAISAANAATAVVDAQLWQSGQTYAQGDAVISPIDLQTYRRKSAGGGTTDPSLDSTNWAQITGIGALPAMGGKAKRALVVNASETAAEWSGFQLGTNAQGNKFITTGEPAGTSPGDVTYQVES